MNNILGFLLRFFEWLLIGFTITSEQNNIYVRGSCNSDLMCHVFTIGDSCNANTVKADSGTVGGSMNTRHCVIKEELKIGGSVNVTDLIHVTKFNIGGSLNGNKIEMQQGNVGGAVNAQNIFCEKNLNVRGSLYINILQCTAFEAGGMTNADIIYAAKGRVNGSMDIKEKAIFTKELFVKGSLHCTGMNNYGSTAVAGIITAKNSIYNDITIKSTGSFFNNGISRYVFDESRNNIDEYEKSEFDACEINSIIIEKSKKQIIELKNNTTVQGDIVFAGNTKGEVRVSGGSQIIGNVINGTITYQ